jgi:hypothetical protein
MKSIIILMLSGFAFINVSDDVNLKYCKALRYLDTSKEIRQYFKVKANNYYKVSEQIINENIYLPFFKEELEQANIQIPDNRFDDTTVVIKTNVNIKKLSLSYNTNLMVFFSEANSNYLFAEIINDTDAYSDDYKDLIVFNTSKVILFFFDKEGSIKNTYIKELNYN